MANDEANVPDSLMPYDAWTEDALRLVAIRALEHAAAQGLPGEHHFYITFRTDRPGVVIPPQLAAKYPEEMTIVLQHQFWDLTVDRAAERFSVGLSFGGVTSTLVIPFAALTGFADPHVRFGVRFSVVEPAAEVILEIDDAPSEAPVEEPAGPAQVVSLDMFRRRRD